MSSTALTKPGNVLQVMQQLLTIAMPMQQLYAKHYVITLQQLEFTKNNLLVYSLV
jgi:hypothetical protein